MSEPRTCRTGVVAGTSTEDEGPRALVVDDNEAQLLVCVRILTGHGYRTEAARDAKAALAALQRTSFDVLVSDIHMPHMSGVELLAEVRARGLDLPIVLITGDPTLDSAMKAMEHGVHRYLTKPVTPSALVLAVNNVVRLHGVARAERLAMDNDALRSLVDELHRAKDAALAGERAKTAFLSKMSHELRTPMSGVIGYVELALDTDLSLQGREYLEAARVAAASLMEILANILDFATLDGRAACLEPEPFSVRQVIETALKAVARAAEAKGLSVITEVGPGVPETLLGDPARFGQVMKTLVGNAIKFTESGEVRVNANLEARRGSDVRLCVSISDTGIGIAKEAIARVFEPFSQQDDSTTRPFGGAGLGLTIASQLVSLMKGSLEIESTPKAGTTVRFTACFERVPAEDSFFTMNEFQGHAAPGRP